MDLTTCLDLLLKKMIPRSGHLDLGGQNQNFSKPQGTPILLCCPSAFHSPCLSSQTSEFCTILSHHRQNGEEFKNRLLRGFSRTSVLHFCQIPLLINRSHVCIRILQKWEMYLHNGVCPHLKLGVFYRRQTLQHMSHPEYYSF